MVGRRTLDARVENWPSDRRHSRDLFSSAPDVDDVDVIVDGIFCCDDD